MTAAGTAPACESGTISGMQDTPSTERPQTYRVEIRFDVTGTLEDAQEAASRAAAALDGEVTEILDEEWNEA